MFKNLIIAVILQKEIETGPVDGERGEDKVETVPRPTKVIPVKSVIHATCSCNLQHHHNSPFMLLASSNTLGWQR
jgi:hypothetical protein